MLRKVSKGMASLFVARVESILAYDAAITRENGKCAESD